ncbi:MAG: hypothetical protein AAGK69_06065 [Pseudomonadota bacterium]
MVDPKRITATLEQFILDLNPEQYGVAIAHLNDAVAAIAAVSAGDATRYALHDRLVMGKAVSDVKRRHLR